MLRGVDVCLGFRAFLEAANFYLTVSLGTSNDNIKNCKICVLE